MKTAIIFLLDNYADWEIAYLSAFLNQNEEWKVKTASIQDELKSIGGLTTKVDYLLKDIPNEINLFVMGGGHAWQSFDSVELNNTLKDYLNGDIVVGAICGAVDYLAKNGFLTNYKHTGNAQYFWRGYEKYMNRQDFVEQQSMVDSNLVTANGTAALDFAQLILEAIRLDVSKNEANIFKSVNESIDMFKLGYYKFCEKYGNPYQ